MQWEILLIFKEKRRDFYVSIKGETEEKKELKLLANHDNLDLIGL
jgi:hypothetical protein